MIGLSLLARNSLAMAGNFSLFSGTCRAPWMCRVSYSKRERTSITIAFSSCLCGSPSSMTATFLNLARCGNLFGFFGHAGQWQRRTDDEQLQWQHLVHD